jgi:hypothetical protein
MISSMAVAEKGTRFVRLYLLLLTVQTVGLAIILSQGAPIYRRILAGSVGPYASPGTLALGLLGVGSIQVAYWLRTFMISSLKLRPSVFLSHIVLFISRLSFIFGAALFTAIMYYRFPELEKSIPRSAVLIAVLFSIFCYALELEWLALELGGPLRSNARLP